MTARAIFSGLLVGTLFGAGLAVSGMIDPARVLGFLDLAGDWDPTLALVMAGALIPSTAAYLLVRRMARPIMAEAFCIPENRSVDVGLLVGSAIFGAGWGLAGFCPGPALAALAFGLWQPWLFVGAMLAGMQVHRLLFARPGRS